MPALKNARHERFAQELAKGETADAAYVAAGYSPSRKNASRLRTNEDVAARLAELQGKAAERTVLTVESITDRLLAIAAKGENSNDAPKLSVARAALMDAAKLNGLVIDKAEIEGKGTVTVQYVTSSKGPPPTPSDEDYETEE